MIGGIIGMIASFLLGTDNFMLPAQSAGESHREVLPERHPEMLSNQRPRAAEGCF
jgi:hypothetical protein